MNFNDEFTSTQESLLQSIDPLIDTISGVILASTTGDRLQLRDKALAMGKATSQTVEKAKQLAVQAKDEDVHRAVAVAISSITSAVHKLITAQTDLLQTVADSDRQRMFALTTKEVGEAINNLLLAADRTFSSKILSFCPRVKSSAEAFINVSSRGELMRLISDHSEDLRRLIIYLKRTASCTIAPEKGKLLDEKAEQLKIADYRLILAKKEEDFYQTSERYNYFRVLIDQTATIAAASGPNFMDKINSAMSRVENLLALALRAATATSRLNALVGHASANEFVKAAKAAAQAALYLVNDATSYLNEITDPVLKAQLEDSIAALRAATHKYLASARAAHENPNDPALRAIMERDYRAMQAALDAVTALLNPGQATPEKKLEATINWMQNLVGRIAEGDPSATRFVGDAEVLGTAVLQLAKQAEDYASLVQEPARARAILDQVQHAAKVVNDFVAIAKAVAARPSDLALKKSLLDAAALLSKSLNNCLKTISCELPEPQYVVSNNSTPSSIVLDESEWDNTDIVRAAKEQAHEALQLADEAMKALAEIKDPAQRQILQQAIDGLRQATAGLIAAARRVAQNPNDSAAQAALAAAQAHLAHCVQTVVGLTVQNAEVDEALRALDTSQTEASRQKEDDIFAMGTGLMAEFESLFLNMENMTGQQLLEASAQLSQAANKLAQQLRELAERTTDPVFKNVLLQSSKLIRDRNVQMKIITAVKAADVKRDQVLGPDNQVLMAAGGVHKEIKDVLSTIQATKLKRRIDASKTQTESIRKILKYYRENPNRPYRK